MNAFFEVPGGATLFNPYGILTLVSSLSLRFNPLKEEEEEEKFLSSSSSFSACQNLLVIYIIPSPCSSYFFFLSFYSQHLLQIPFRLFIGDFHSVAVVVHHIL